MPMQNIYDAQLGPIRAEIELKNKIERCKTVFHESRK